MRMSDENLERLPMWAQRKIYKLERDLADALEREATMLGAPENSNVIIGVGFEDKPLPMDSQITFFPTQDRKSQITARIRDGGLYINGWHALSILPSATNSFDIRDR